MTKGRPRPPPPEIQERLDLHRAWLKTWGKEGVRLDCAEGELLDLSNLLLDGADLSFAVLPGAIFHGAHLRSAWLVKASLPDANFTKADISGAHFDGADLTWCTFVEAKYVGMTVVGARLDFATWTRAEAASRSRRARRSIKAFFDGVESANPDQPDPSPV
ncbi:MAG TPA: pentapeptide repeat-containing protein [Bryobacteraceae bacterium]|jgi:uncharacterized protein YjbI with pentapeptide repeats